MEERLRRQLKTPLSRQLRVASKQERLFPAVEKRVHIRYCFDSLRALEDKLLTDCHQVGFFAEFLFA